MSLKINLDPLKPEVSVGDHFNVWQNGKNVGSAEVLDVDDEFKWCEVEVSLESGKEFDGDIEYLSEELFKIEINNWAASEGRKYYIGIE